MSIYATLREWSIGERTVFFQGVPSWVDFVAPYLPPPIPDEPDKHGHIRNRVVIVVDDLTDKGGEGYGGQQYHYGLARLTHEEYEAAMETKRGRDRLRSQLRRAIERVGRPA